MQFTIYCLTNRVNGKRYVGQTRLGLDIRWSEHIKHARRNGGCRVLTAAIRKYGSAVFIREVLEMAATLDEANIAEVRWIKAFSCRVPNGYNLNAGGNERNTHETTRKKMSIAHRAFWADPKNRARAAEIRLRYLYGLSPEERVRKSEPMRTAGLALSTEERSAWVKKGCMTRRNPWAGMSESDKKVKLAKLQLGRNTTRGVAALAACLSCVICGSKSTVASSKRVRLGRANSAYCAVHRRPTGGASPKRANRGVSSAT